MLHETEVLVVGAGPVGVVAAYRLAQAGIAVTLVESNSTCVEDLRASTIHPPTLEMFHSLGIVDALISQGLKAPVYHFRERQTGEVVAFDFSELADVTKFPFRLQCEQYKISRMLVEKLRDTLNQTVWFSHKLQRVDQDERKITAQVLTEEGTKQISADFLIAADGGGSAVRKELAIPFVGSTYSEKFLTFSTDTRLENYFENFAWVNYVADASEWASVILTPSGWRLLVPAPGELSDAELTSDNYKNRVFARLIGGTENVQTHHRTVYRVNQRVAQTYYSGRVALAGDSAHVHNPLGGFGMNSGIHDAWNLSDKLIQVLREQRSKEESLAQYDRQRRTIMNNFVQAQSAQNKAYMEADSARVHSIERSRLERIAADPAQRREYLLKQSMLTSRHQERQIA